MLIRYADLRPTAGGYTELKLVVDGDREAIDELVRVARKKPGGYRVEIKRVAEKRTLQANRYYWALIEQLATKLKIGNNELHEQMLAEYGVTDQYEDGDPMIFAVKEEIKVKIPGMHIVAYGEGYNEGHKFIYYRVLKHSSEMDAIEFCRLLDGLIHECKLQNIETRTPAEIENMKRALRGEIYG